MLSFMFAILISWFGIGLLLLIWFVIILLTFLFKSSIVSADNAYTCTPFFISGYIWLANKCAYVVTGPMYLVQFSTYAVHASSQPGLAIFDSKSLKIARDEMLKAFNPIKFSSKCNFVRCRLLYLVFQFDCKKNKSLFWSLSTRLLNTYLEKFQWKLKKQWNITLWTPWWFVFLICTSVVHPNFDLFVNFLTSIVTFLELPIRHFLNFNMDRCKLQDIRMSKIYILNSL